MRKNQGIKESEIFSISELISLTDEIIDDDIILLATKSVTFLKLCQFNYSVAYNSFLSKIRPVLVFPISIMSFNEIFYAKI